MATERIIPTIVALAGTNTNIKIQGQRTIRNIINPHWLEASVGKGGIMDVPVGGGVEVGVDPPLPASVVKVIVTGEYVTSPDEPTAYVVK